MIGLWTCLVEHNLIASNVGQAAPLIEQSLKEESYPGELLLLGKRKKLSGRGTSSSKDGRQ